MSAAARIFAVALALITFDPARAQNEDKDSITDKLAYFAVFGYGGSLTANRWNPVRVNVSLGGESVQGTVELRYTTDGTQEHRAIAPFTTTPNKLIPVDLLICPYIGTQSITLTINLEHGPDPRPIRYATQSWTGNSNYVPMRNTFEAAAITIGDTGFRFAARTAVARRDIDPDFDDSTSSWSSAGGAFSQEQVWNDYLSVSPINPAEAPMSWAAYDALRLIVADADDIDLLSPEALEQITRWVRSGGRLMLLADAPGNAWNRWLADDFAKPPIQVAPPTPSPLPADLMRVFTGIARDLPRGSAPPPAQTAPARAITLTPTGKAEGWRLRWRHPDQPESAFLAEGPMGFGLVTILTLAPTKAPEVLSSFATGRIWQDAAGPILEDWQNAAKSAGGNVGWGLQTSVTGRANSAVISSFVDFEAAGTSVFVFIAVGILALAIFLGPFDAIVLRRLRKRQFSYLTALLWIALAAALAITAPNTIRAGPAKVRQLQATDTLIAHADPTVTLTANTEALGIFANRSGRAKLTQRDPTSFTNGISAITSAFNTNQAVGGVFSTTQRLAEQRLGRAPTGAPLDELRLNLWTFRTFLTRAPANWNKPTPRAAISRSPNSWAVDIEDLPPQSTVGEVVLRTVRGYLPVTRFNQTSEQASPIDAWHGKTSGRPAAAPPEGWDFNDPQHVDSLGWYPWSSVIYIPAASLALQGPDNRDLAIQRRIQSGRWACLYISIDDITPTIDIEGWTTQGKAHAVLRLLVPLDENDALTPHMDFSEPAK